MHTTTPCQNSGQVLNSTTKQQSMTENKPSSRIQTFATSASPVPFGKRVFHYRNKSACAKASVLLHAIKAE
jgi:hypothetical protein